MPVSVNSGFVEEETIISIMFDVWKDKEWAASFRCSYKETESSISDG